MESPPLVSCSSTLGSVRQYSVALIASLCVLTAGSAYTWIEPLMERMKKGEQGVHLTSTQISWVASVIEIGPLATPIPVGLLMNRLGRKTLLLIAAPIYVLSWVLVLTTRSYEVLLAVRVMQGMGIGIIMTTVPLYLSEIADPYVRGSVGTFVQCMWYLGVIYVYLIGPLVTYEQLTWACFAPPLTFMLLFVWFPESPYCLSLQGKSKQATETLYWFRGQESPTEMKDIIESVAEEKKNKARWSDLLRTPQGRRAFCVVFVVGLTTYMSGLRTVQAYASDTFSETTKDPSTSAKVTLAMGVLTLVSTAFSSVLVDRLGRRPLLLLSAVGSSIVLLLAALFFFIEFHTNYSTKTFSYTPYITITLYSVLMSLSSSIGFTLQAEMFPTSTRGIASGTITFSTTLMCFTSLKLYNVFQQTLGLYFNYLVFGLFAGIGSIVIYKITPETKGKTFSQIQEMLR